MHKRLSEILTGLLALGVSVLTVSVATADQSVKNILPPPEKLSAHVYAWIGPLDGPSKENQGYRMNLAFVVGAEAVAVLDTGYTRGMGEEMLAHIRKVTDKPVKYAINTTSQPHRFMGNPAFREAGATIIAHPSSAERMAAQSGNFAAAIERILELPEGDVTLPQPPDQLIREKT